MTVGRLDIPGDATRREYAVYIMVATHRITCEIKLYVGKTGDNREGCNPVISRAGNHFSFNKMHSQMRNYLLPDEPHEFDFSYFYVTFDEYIDPKHTRERIDVINEMERRLNSLAQERFGQILNPYSGKHIARKKQVDRDGLATGERWIGRSNAGDDQREGRGKSAIELSSAVHRADGRHPQPELRLLYSPKEVSLPACEPGDFGRLVVTFRGSRTSGFAGRHTDDSYD